MTIPIQKGGTMEPNFKVWLKKYGNVGLLPINELSFQCFAPPLMPEWLA